MDPYFTLTGNLVADPTQVVTASGAKLTKFRLASNRRRFDQATNDYVNTDTMFMNVTCWRQLGDNAFRSLHKGDTVVVYGRIRYREYDDGKDGTRRRDYELEALAVGPDLARYVTTHARPMRDLVDAVPPQPVVGETEVAEPAA